MFGINASRDITPMTNRKTLRDRAVCDGIGGAMGEPSFAFMPKDAVPTLLHVAGPEGAPSGAGCGSIFKDVSERFRAGTFRRTEATATVIARPSARFARRARNRAGCDKALPGTEAPMRLTRPDAKLITALFADEKNFGRLLGSHRVNSCTVDDLVRSVKPLQRPGGPTLL